MIGSVQVVNPNSEHYNPTNFVVFVVVFVTCEVPSTKCLNEYSFDYYLSDVMMPLFIWRVIWEESRNYYIRKKLKTKLEKEYFTLQMKAWRFNPTVFFQWYFPASSQKSEIPAKKISQKISETQIPRTKT